MIFECTCHLRDKILHTRGSTGSSQNSAGVYLHGVKASKNMGIWSPDYLRICLKILATQGKLLEWESADIESIIQETLQPFEIAPHWSHNCRESTRTRYLNQEVLAWETCTSSNVLWWILYNCHMDLVPWTKRSTTRWDFSRATPFHFLHVFVIECSLDVMVLHNFQQLDQVVLVQENIHWHGSKLIPAYSFFKTII